MMILSLTLLFLLGLIIGSGINALVYRVHSGKSFVHGRSLCPHCKHVLGPLDLIPVVSFLFLRGKCRYCKKSISWTYPAIELFTALSFVGFAAFSQYVSLVSFPSSLDIARIFFACVYIAYLVFILEYDAKYLIIPDGAVFSLLPIALFGSVFIFHIPFIHIALGAALGFGFFGALYVVSQGKWIGFGDVKFGLVLGVLLGFPGMIMDLFFAYIVGAVFATAVLLLKKKHLKDRIAFGPFLALAALFVMIFGQAIAQWYIGLL